MTCDHLDGCDADCPMYRPPAAALVAVMEGDDDVNRYRLLQDIRDRDAQTELVPAARSPLGRRGTAYDHARQQHSDYHLDSDELAMGDRHMLLVWLREVPRSVLDGILAAPNDPADWPEYADPAAAVGLSENTNA